jgi:hypothetical protein
MQSSGTPLITQTFPELRAAAGGARAPRVAGWIRGWVFTVVVTIEVPR